MKLIKRLKRTLGGFFCFVFLFFPKPNVKLKAKHETIWSGCTIHCRLQAGLKNYFTLSVASEYSNGEKKSILEMGNQA